MQTVESQAHTAQTSKRKARASSLTYKEIFTALGPVEPLHHRGGLHLLPLHAGDAAQLHGVALDSLCFRGHFYTHREADADWREHRGQGRDSRQWERGRPKEALENKEGKRGDREESLDKIENACFPESTPKFPKHAGSEQEQSKMKEMWMSQTLTESLLLEAMKMQHRTVLVTTLKV